LSPGVQGQPGQHSQALSHSKKKKKLVNYLFLKFLVVLGFDLRPLAVGHVLSHLSYPTNPEFVSFKPSDN
jgi:hypothetical protein